MSTIIFAIIIILLQIGSFIFIYFFKSYFTEKGSNWATKQDIKKITENIEEVKLKYAKILEITKNEYNLTTQSLRTFYSQKDDIAFQFYEDASILFYELHNNNFSFFHIDKNDRSYDPNITSKLESELTTKMAKLSVLFDGEHELLGCANDLISFIYIANSKYNEVRSTIYSKKTNLLDTNVFVETNGKLIIFDQEKVNEYYQEMSLLTQNYIYEIYSMNTDFNDKRKLYLNKVQAYYNIIKKDLNNIK